MSISNLVNGYACLSSGCVCYGKLEALQTKLSIRRQIVCSLACGFPLLLLPLTCALASTIVTLCCAGCLLWHTLT